MATVSRSDSKHMYSWWCASHISPKNSKWLQQNLTDMDVKYKLMKRNLELGDGSFGEKAEMYFKRRPELTELVEDFYRTYRALAERYDHATVVIRQAHQTMAEAFPSQVPYIVSDEGSFVSGEDSDPRTPEMIGLSSDPVGLSPSTSHSVDRNGTFGSKDSPFAKFPEGRARRGLNFPESEGLGKSDIEFQNLEAEKDNMSSAQEDAERHAKRACEAEEEAQALKEELAQVKVEKEDGLAKYVEALESIGNLERADDAEKEVAALKEALARITEEKEAAAHQYEQCLERISALENEIAISRQEASRLGDVMHQRSNKSMQIELDSVLKKLGIQNQQLSEKQTKLGTLWTEIQEERVRVVEAETALGMRQGLHSKTKEELRSIAAELQKRVQMLKDMEVHNQNLQGEIQKMSDENKSLNEISISSTATMKNMHDEITSGKMQSVCQDLQAENYRFLEQNRNLSEALTYLDEEKHKIEHDNSCLVVEAVSLDTLSLIFKSIVQERSELIDNLSHDNSCLIVESVALDTLSLVYQSSMLESSELINHLTVDTVKLHGDNSALQDKMRIMESMMGEYHTESMSLKASLESYGCEMSNFKTINSELEHEIADGKSTLSQKVMELFGAEAVRDNQKKQINELSEKYDEQVKESERLRTSIQNLYAELCRMHEKDGETNEVVEELRLDLEKGKDEIELWETVAGNFFVELQSSSVREALYREKLSELTKEYQFLADKSNANELEALQLRQRWADYIPALASLSDSVSSLEKHVMFTKLDDGADQDTSSPYILSNGDAVAPATSDGFSNLHNISSKIKAVEIKVEETKKLAFSDPHEAEGEIMLDQTMDRSGGYHNSGSGDQILEVWENTNQSVSIIDLTVGRTRHYSSESVVEKELRIDSLEISKRFSGRSEPEDSKKILQRLNSDVQKLTNLQETVQDLKKKVSVTEKSPNLIRKGKENEYSNAKDQLDEADSAIVKLLEVNRKLVKHVEDNSNGSSSSIGDSSEIGGSTRRRNVSDQARRFSEKMGRLQLEVQKLQILFVKLDGGSSKSKGKASETQMVGYDARRVVLNDYLYGAAHTPRRDKKNVFCGCGPAFH